MKKNFLVHMNILLPGRRKIFAESAIYMPPSKYTTKYVVAYLRVFIEKSSKIVNHSDSGILILNQRCKRIISCRVLGKTNFIIF